MPIPQSTSSPGSAAGTVARDAAARHRVPLLTVARGGAGFCIRLGDVSEVGRLKDLTRMDGADDAVLGSMVLHGETVPVVDVAVAIGAVRKPDDDPKMFAPTRTRPVVCVAFDEIVGKHGGGEEDAGTHPHELVRGLVAIGGRSLPVIDVHAVSQLTEGTA